MRFVVWASTLTLALLTPACGPTASRCAQMMPVKVSIEGIQPGETPDGTGACITKVDDVPLTVELERSGFIDSVYVGR